MVIIATSRQTTMESLGMFRLGITFRFKLAQSKAEDERINVIKHLEKSFGWDVSVSHEHLRHSLMNFFKKLSVYIVSV